MNVTAVLQMHFGRDEQVRQKAAQCDDLMRKLNDINSGVATAGSTSYGVSTSAAGNGAGELGHLSNRQRKKQLYGMGAQNRLKEVILTIITYED